ncbi:MAG TPA: hypothetical protein VMA74_20770 [Dyella sp.]|uniref:hypothetical protein n=1 Tax=Dyella sp. TaxID=1869338 RepID=UPI002CAE8DD4|nr:hypothetical protein [Dyella sp.]HUB92170.1 hypothetical protein [Dyella sp.]
MMQNDDAVVIRDSDEMACIVEEAKPIVVVADRPQVLVVPGQACPPVVVSDRVEERVMVPWQPPAPIVRMGFAGPQGIPGQVGDLSFTVTAAVDVGYPQVVAIVDGAAHLADPTNVADMMAELAITTQAAAAGNPVTVNIFFSLSEPGWNWQPGRMYLGPAPGQISQSPSTTGALLEVGRAVNATTINFNIRTPIMQ